MLMVKRQQWLQEGCLCSGCIGVKDFKLTVRIIYGQNLLILGQSASSLNPSIAG